MKVIYIAGPITGRLDYRERFNRMEQKLMSEGFTVLNPAKLPRGLTNEQYTHINFAQIGAADAVVLLPRWEDSPGARLEVEYCRYIGKPVYLSIEELTEGGDW